MPVVTVVVGGAHRGDSVAAGLAALSPGVDTVLVHDFSCEGNHAALVLTRRAARAWRN